MLPKNSPLRNFPDDLPAREVLFLDGIRYSMDISELAFRRLEAVLLSLAEEDVPEGQDVAPLIVSAFADAWVIVDSVNRLRDLLRELPGHKTQELKNQRRIFLDKTEPVDQLRNMAQHLESKEILAMAKTAEPIWGSISWAVQRVAGEGRVCTIVAGRLPKRMPRVDPLQKVRIPIDLVTLVHRGIVADLGVTLRASAVVVDCLEASLRPTFKGKPTGGADVLLNLTWKAQPEGEPPPERELADTDTIHVLGSSENYKG